MSKFEEDIYDIVADKADVDRVKLVRDARLDDLEIESLDIVEIIFAIEEKFDIQIPYNANDAEMEFETVGQVVDAVQKVIEEQS
ncbi:MAG: acyl carrier protein [Rhodospirillaceae bacterium]|nr:acyl carrier protein [Rhodospirillaceae bacterium]|tara:strand:- start:937 stop:1188 length:252 start_codon:yes stop_codon:yes gene_type:complete